MRYRYVSKISRTQISYSFDAIGNKCNWSVIILVPGVCRLIFNNKNICSLHEVSRQICMMNKSVK